MKKKIYFYLISLTTMFILVIATFTNATADELSIELLSAEIKDGYLVANVCFNIPSDQDWVLAISPEEVVLSVNDEKINISTFQLVEEQYSTLGKKNGRCDELFFEVKDMKITEFSISFYKLTIPMAEQPDCNETQEKLNNENLEISIQCYHEKNEFGFDVISKPESLSDTDARQTVFDILNESVEIEWVLEAQLGSM